MNKDRRDKIISDYNKLYESEDSSGRRSMRWGFECGDGWLDLIENLSCVIQWHVDQKQKNDPTYQQVKVSQCKEKFGSLRFYTYGGDDFVNGAIAMAERMSSHICESCGNPGTMRREGWWNVTCDPCEVKKQEARVNAGSR